jgi:hypothetical protein
MALNSLSYVSLSSKMSAVARSPPRPRSQPRAATAPSPVFAIRHKDRNQPVRSRSPSPVPGGNTEAVSDITQSLMIDTISANIKHAAANFNGSELKSSFSRPVDTVTTPKFDSNGLNNTKPVTRQSMFASMLPSKFEEREPTIYTQDSIDPVNSPLLSKYPVPEFLPFLPQPHLLLGDYNPKHLDIIVQVEHCCDCPYHNDLTLRHDQRKYISVANQAIHAIVKSLAAKKFSVRVYALRSKFTSAARVGALEISISVRIGLALATSSTLPVKIRQSFSQNNSVKAAPTWRKGKEIIQEPLKLPQPHWASTLLFSKLKSTQYVSLFSSHLCLNQY